MKTQKKQKTFTAKQLEVAIDQQHHFTTQVRLTCLLMDFYRLQPDNFKKVFQSYITDWKYGVTPFENVEQFGELCDEISSSLTHYWFANKKYPYFIHNSAYSFIGFTKNKKKMTDVETLLDWFDLVYEKSPEDAYQIFCEEGKIK